MSALSESLIAFRLAAAPTHYGEKSTHVEASEPHYEANALLPPKLLVVCSDSNDVSEAGDDDDG